MTFYVHIDDDGAQDYPLTLPDIRFANPNVSFPPQPSEADLAPFGYYAVLQADAPATSIFQTAERAGVSLVDGSWVEQWAIVDWSSEQISQATDAQWPDVRTDRNQRLANCDWTQLQDAPVDSTVWATYRQALRDITTQSDPFNIQWPEKPA